MKDIQPGILFMLLLMPAQSPAPSPDINDLNEFPALSSSKVPPPEDTTLPSPSKKPKAKLTDLNLPVDYGDKRSLLLQVP